LEMQRQAGLGIFTDGEYRRAMWLTGLPAAVEGFVSGPVPLISRWHVPESGAAERLRLTPASTGQGWAIGGKLQPKRRITGEESAFLKQHAPGPYKITIPSPTWFLRGWQRGLSDQAYPTPDDA